MPSQHVPTEQMGTVGRMHTKAKLKVGHLDLWHLSTSIFLIIFHLLVLLLPTQNFILPSAKGFLSGFKLPSAPKCSNKSNPIKVVPPGCQYLASITFRGMVYGNQKLVLLPSCSEKVTDPGAGEGSASLTLQQCFRDSVPSSFLLLSCSGKQGISGREGPL